MNQSTKIILTGCALAVALTLPAQARIHYGNLTDPHKDYTQRGVQLYVGLGDQSYTVDDKNYSYLKERESNGMFFFGMAIGLDRGVSLFFEGNGSSHRTPAGDMTFGFGQIGLKYAPNSGYRHLWQPYGKLSFGGLYLFEDQSAYALRHHHDGDNGYLGHSVGMALGVDRFIGRRTALFAEAGLTTGALDTRVIDGHNSNLADDVAITSGRLQFGFRFRL